MPGDLKAIGNLEGLLTQTKLPGKHHQHVSDGRGAHNETKLHFGERLRKNVDLASSSES